MQGTTQSPNGAGSERRFRDQVDEPSDADYAVEIGASADGPLEVVMTDEPGGDPYNHTGRFKRIYR